MQTEKDAEIVGWLGRIGAASAEHVMARFGMGAEAGPTLASAVWFVTACSSRSGCSIERRACTSLRRKACAGRFRSASASIGWARAASNTRGTSRRRQSRGQIEATRAAEVADEWSR